MDEKRSIGNVNILDLRKATEESVAQIGLIGNANVVLYSPETARLMSRLSFGNLNASAEVPSENVQVLAGKAVLNHGYFESKTDPEFLVIAGKLQVESDVSPEDIESKISGLVVLGKVLCPENLAGALQAKSKMTMGKFAVYPILNQVRFTDLTLDKLALNAMEDHSELAVIGQVTCPEVLPDELLAQKLAKLYVLDGITCHQENAAYIGSHLYKNSAAIRVIPSGYEWIQQEITLDEITLAGLSGRKIFCTETVVIDAEVTPGQLEQGLGGLVCEGNVFCPSDLKESLASKCDLLKTRVTFYSGTLWRVEGDEKLYASFLEALDSKLTLVVYGHLTIDSAVEAKILADRIAKVHNYGAIHCPPELIGILQLRLGIKEGVILPPNIENEEKKEEYGIGNANYLAL